jgi:hypothetical protein
MYGYQYIGFIDCIEQCIPETYLGWLGDGLCDDGSWGVYFNCDEWNWDEGDCPEYSNHDDNNIEYRSESQLGDLVPFTTASEQNSRDLIAFNIYRDGNLLISVEAGTYEYDDYDVVNLEEYCYYITSVYTEGEAAEPTEEICAIPEPGIPPTNLFAIGESGAITLPEPPTHCKVIAPDSPIANRLVGGIPGSGIAQISSVGSAASPSVYTLVI